MRYYKESLKKKKKKTLWSLSLMNHPNGCFLNVLILLLFCCRITSSLEGTNKPTFLACPCQTVKLPWHNSPIKSENAAVVNRSVWWCIVGDPQVVPVSGLCLPPGGHLHQRGSALWLLDSRKGKLLSLCFHPTLFKEALSTEGVRWGDSPWWFTLLIWCG